jgi:hypothetical protein
VCDDDEEEEEVETSEDEEVKEAEEMVDGVGDGERHAPSESMETGMRGDFGVR